MKTNGNATEDHNNCEDEERCKPKQPQPSESISTAESVANAVGNYEETMGTDTDSSHYIHTIRNRPNYISPNTTRTIADERKEISAKRSNIIIYGLEETSPQEEIREIVNLNKALGNHEFTKYNIKKLGRIGDKHRDQVRPLKIELDNHITKLNILRNTKLLPHIQQYKHLSIQHDLTKRQHHQLRQLKEEARKQEANDNEGRCKYRVRGPPGRWEIVTLPKN